jgi:hypothetical protein
MLEAECEKLTPRRGGIRIRSSPQFREEPKKSGEESQKREGFPFQTRSRRGKREILGEGWAIADFLGRGVCVVLLDH